MQVLGRARLRGRSTSQASNEEDSTSRTVGMSNDLPNGSVPI